MGPVDVKTQLEEILKGVEEVLPTREALGERLERAAKEGRPLRVKLGIDPSGTDIHLGHTVTLWKLRRFQELGHQAVLIIGDYTAMVGDPSGRDSVRPQLDHDQVIENAKAYQAQIARIVDLERAEVHYNGAWFGKFGLSDVIRLGATTTLMRMLERKDFKERVENNEPLYLHELLYPLMQGWDSVEIRADVELGGTDQTFNILRGRDLMGLRGLEPQLGLTLPLLLGLDGQKKMGKSAGNYIGLHDAPEDMYGKVMSVPDELIVHYLTLAIPSTAAEVAEVAEGLAGGALGAMEAKLGLARRVTAQYHGEAAAGAAAEHFQRVVRERQAPEALPVLALTRTSLPISAVDLVFHSGSLPSKSEARRRIEQRGVQLDGRTLEDPFEALSPASGAVLKVSKRDYFELRLGDDE
jgi:tyrosyl-tRNA synthetase